jgi:hypothetical protein
MKDVPPPPPPLVHDLLPHPAPRDEDIFLNINIPVMFLKMNISIHVVVMFKIPSIRIDVLNELKVQYEAQYPSVILDTMYHGKQGEDNPPLYLSLGINGFCLNNYMFDSGASTNIMSLKVMKELGLWTTHPYGNICGINSKKLKVYVLIEYVEVYLQASPYIILITNIIVIDVLDAWGMFL